MVNKKFFKQKNISLAVQSYSLNEKFPNSECEIKKNKLIWKGIIKPTPLSREYNIKIIYILNKRPQVILYGKKIDGIERKDFPHKFKIDKNKQEVEICLYYHNEFNSSERISITIIPWIQEWLYFYEIWLLTGEWCGGGHTFD